MVAPSLAFDIAEEVAQKLEQERKGESEETMEAAAAPSNYPVVAPYGACGGESSHPCKMAGVCAACTPGWECVPKGRWYSQCIPSVGESSDDAATPSEVEEKPEQEDVEKPVQEDEEDIVAPVAMAADPFVVPEDSEGLAGTTRFFDGCKATCSWEGNVGKTVSGPVQSCSNKFDENGNQIR